NASVSVTGPNAYSAALTASQTLQGLAAGTYTVSASSVSITGTTYVPTPTTQNVGVSAGATASATVTYSASAPAGLNLMIDGLYITQSVQSYSGTVPLVAGRGAFLRVFVKASQGNTAQPTVRVRFYSGATLVSTITIPAPGASVPTSITEGT